MMRTFSQHCTLVGLLSLSLGGIACDKKTEAPKPETKAEKPVEAKKAEEPKEAAVPKPEDEEDPEGEPDAKKEDPGAGGW